MLRSSACLAADDVSVPCRIRHSPFTTNREFNQPEEMICVMRIWHQTRTPGQNQLTKPAKMKKSRSFGSPAFDRSMKNKEAELILNSIHNPLMVHGCNSSGELGNPIRMSHRFQSFGSSSDARILPTHRQNVPQQEEGRRLGNVTIPISDIMVVDMYGEGESHCTNITTMSNGLFEFTMENRNGQEVLLAFLKASLPKERIMDGPIQRASSDVSSNTAGSSKTFDVEAFTASRMSERLQRESFSEKLRRKVGRVISSIEEVTSNITDCSCGCGPSAVSPAPVNLEKRDSPPRQRQYDFEVVELAAEPTPVLERPAVTMKSSSGTKARRNMLSQYNMPSGLSVEDPEMDSTI